ncbi:MAG: hypothetical protein U5J63_01705 [Fodinibius sp.]|nr:hypothetical protein [Fodinibius sp.]
MCCTGGIRRLIAAYAHVLLDDLLWLPYVTAFYINHTGDRDILDEQEPFVSGATAAAG